MHTMQNTEEQLGGIQKAEMEQGKADFSPWSSRLKCNRAGKAGEEAVANQLQETPTDLVLSNSTSSEDKGLPHHKQSLHRVMTSIYQYIFRRGKIVLSLSNFFSPGGR